MTSTALPGAAHNTNHGHPVIARLLDGGHPWGDLFVGFVDRSGGSQYQLVLFPPGTTAEQRRALVFRRRWIPWGVILGFVVASGLGILINGWAAVGVGVAIYLGGLVLANAHAGSARHGVVDLRARVLNLMGERESFGDFDLIENAASELLELDELAAADEIDPVEYELRWGEIYGELVAQKADAQRP